MKRLRRAGCLVVVLALVFQVARRISPDDWNHPAPIIRNHPGETRFAMVQKFADGGQLLRIGPLPMGVMFYGGATMGVVGAIRTFGWRDDRTLVVEMGPGGKLESDHWQRLGLKESGLNLVAHTAPWPPRKGRSRSAANSRPSVTADTMRGEAR